MRFYCIGSWNGYFLTVDEYKKQLVFFSLTDKADQLLKTYKEMKANYSLLLQKITKLTSER